MEMALNNGFYEMSQDEISNIDGGVAPIVVFGVTALAGLGAGYVFGYFLG